MDMQTLPLQHKNSAPWKIKLQSFRLRKISFPPPPET